MTSPVCFPPADSDVFLVLLRMLLQHFSLICHRHVSGRAPLLHSPPLLQPLQPHILSFENQLMVDDVGARDDLEFAHSL